jgi:hypothetical protein
MFALDSKKYVERTPSEVVVSPLRSADVPTNKLLESVRAIASKKIMAAESISSCHCLR